MIFIALWVTSLPGVVGRIQAFGTGPLLAVTAGLIVLCLLRTPIRWLGGALVVAGSLWAANAPRPDVLIAADGQAVAACGTDGRLSFMRSGNDSFAVREWLAADGDPRTVKDTGLRDGVRCDEAGCIARLADGRLGSLAFTAAAFEEDCARAAVVASPRDATPRPEDLEAGD